MAKLNIMQMTADERNAHNAAQLAKLTNVSVPSIAFHSDCLKNWLKQNGPKPTAEQLKVNYVLAADRRAGVEPLWVAMTMRDNGATVGEYMAASKAGGAAHNNAKKINDQSPQSPGWLMRVPLPNTDRNGRWQHVFTEKGIAQLDKRIAQLSAAAQPVADKKPVKATAKPKGKAKAKKAKVTLPLSGAEVTVKQPVDTTGLFDNAAQVTPEANATPITAADTGEAAEAATSASLTALAQHFNS